MARMRYGKIVFGIAAASCLLLAMQTGKTYGQTAKAGTAAGDDTGLIDVKQSDLLQKQVTDNWSATTVTTVDAATRP